MKSKSTALERKETAGNPSSPARDAARIMYDALQKISRADAFFEAEKRLKQIAVRALEEVERLSGG